LELIRSKGIEPEVIDYQKMPLSEFDIEAILKKLGVNAEDIVRKNEALYKEEFKGKVNGEKQFVKMLAENPKLIERPIVVEKNMAIIGRPPEKVLILIN
jgi:arsenate reductase